MLACKMDDKLEILEVQNGDFIFLAKWFVLSLKRHRNRLSYD